MIFKKYKMEDVLETLIDYRGKTPQKSDTGRMTLSAKSVRDGYIDYSQCYYISEDEYNRFMVRGFPKIGDVLLTTEAPLGITARLDRDDVALAQRLLTIRGKEGVLDTGYLYYYLRSPLGQAKLRERQTGTTVTGIKQAEFRKIEIEIPYLVDQRKISTILGNIDQKVTVNKRINENLLQQLSEIYRSWYIDFSTVSEDFISSEYGDIPIGWHYKQLGDVCQSISVTHKFNKDQLIFLNTGDIDNGQFLQSSYMPVKDMPGQAKKTICPDDILYSEIRPANKHFAYVNFPSEDYVVSTKLMVIRSKGIDSRRLYHFLTMKETLAELQLQAESRSGTFPQIRFDNVSRLPILIADAATENTFTGILHSVYRQIERNIAENDKLAQIRDSLLPKLMTGELDVSKLDL